MGTIVHSQANNKTDQQNQNPKNLNLNFTPYTNINSKETVGLNVKCKTIKLLGKKHGGKYLESTVRQKVLRLDTEYMIPEVKSSCSVTSNSATP